MSPISDERAIFSDHDGAIYGVLTPCSAIVTSRKRKLRELFAVATQVESLPNEAFANTDAPAPTPAENKFLHDSDILQYVCAIDSRFWRGSHGRVCDVARSPTLLLAR